MDNRSTRKVREGIVVSNKMQKTAVVKVSQRIKHPLFDKIVLRSKKYYAHVEDDMKVSEGQRVKIMETRPMSKLKRWRVVEVSGI